MRSNILYVNFQKEKSNHVIYYSYQNQLSIVAVTINVQFNISRLQMFKLALSSVPINIKKITHYINL